MNTGFGSFCIQQWSHLHQGRGHYLDPFLRSFSEPLLDSSKGLLVPGSVLDPISVRIRAGLIALTGASVVSDLVTREQLQQTANWPHW